MSENDSTTPTKKVIIRKLRNNREVSQEELQEDLNTFHRIVGKYVELNVYALKARREEAYRAARPHPRAEKGYESYVAQVESILLNAWRDGE